MVRIRLSLQTLEDRVVPSFDHLAYARDLFHRMPWVVQGVVHSAGSSEYADIRPIWNERFPDNAELAALRGTSAEWATGLMLRSPWTGRLTVYYLVNVATNETFANGILAHEFIHWMDWSYREAYYGIKISQSDWWQSIYDSLGQPGGNREEAFACYSTAWILTAETGPASPQSDVYFSNLYGPPNTVAMPGAVYQAAWFAALASDSETPFSKKIT